MNGGSVAATVSEEVTGSGPQRQKGERYLSPNRLHLLLFLRDFTDQTPC